MERLAQKLHGENFVVLAVDAGEDADTIQTFTSQLESALRFPFCSTPTAKPCKLGNWSACQRPI
ncbi:MAG: hypothetical protein Q8L71_12395 [Thiobacillus sp.]|nr:hypothetical protein [Thiobacillus sp.]